MSQFLLVWMLVSGAEIMVLSYVTNAHLEQVSRENDATLLKSDMYVKAMKLKEISLKIFAITSFVQIMMFIF